MASAGDINTGGASAVALDVAHPNKKLWVVIVNKIKMSINLQDKFISILSFFLYYLSKFTENWFSSHK